MAIVVIGGHSRNIGKTSVACALISAMPLFNWTAIKITQFGNGVCSANGEPCDCETADHTLAISEERDRTSGTDTSRFLDAGAARSLWVRTRQGQLLEAMPRLRAEMARSGHVILESNSVMRFLQPDVYAAVLDPDVADFKASALRYLDRADAILSSHGSVECSAWDDVSLTLIRGIPIFPIAPPRYHSAEFAKFVERAIEKAGRQSPPLS